MTPYKSCGFGDDQIQLFIYHQYNDNNNTMERNLLWSSFLMCPHKVILGMAQGLKICVGKYNTFCYEPVASTPGAIRLLNRSHRITLCGHHSITLEEKKGRVPEWSTQAIMNWNGNFGLVFGWGEIILTCMIFAYHWTSKVSRTSKKFLKGQKKFRRP